MTPYYADATITLWHGANLQVLPQLAAGSVDCCVTSPPFYGLRDYGIDGQYGAEDSPAAFVANLVATFREVRQVLADDGTLWLNLGDSYSGSWGNQGRKETLSQCYDDKGGASRFYYTAKAGADERPGGDGISHPTVKPLDLMCWLVRLVTPRGGLVLDPFAGSGTTLEAALREGFACVGIEREAEYLPLIVARVSRPMTYTLFGVETPPAVPEPVDRYVHPTLFEEDAV